MVYKSSMWSIQKGFRNGDTLEIRWGLVGDPSNYEMNGESLAIFRDCKIIRGWIPKPIAMSPMDENPIDFWYELECRNWTLNIPPEDMSWLSASS